MDKKYIFDLIKNNNIFSLNIKKQKFIQMATAFNEKVLFKIENNYYDLLKEKKKKLQNIF